jgi:hypothetical protein
MSTGADMSDVQNIPLNHSEPFSCSQHFIHVNAEPDIVSAVNSSQQNWKVRSSERRGASTDAVADVAGVRESQLRSPLGHRESIELYLVMHRS